MQSEAEQTQSGSDKAQSRGEILQSKDGVCGGADAFNPSRRFDVGWGLRVGCIFYLVLDLLLVGGAVMVTMMGVEVELR